MFGKWWPQILEDFFGQSTTLQLYLSHMGNLKLLIIFFHSFIFYVIIIAF